MNAPVKSIADRWLKTLDDINVPGRQHRVPPEDFNNSFDQFAAQLARNVAKDPNPLDSSWDDEKMIAQLKKRYAGFFMQGGQVTGIKNWYSVAYDLQKELSDKRRQENWSNSWDHAKTILYRTLTTIMIAAVILATGFLAKLWEIPIPMLRGL